MAEDAPAPVAARICNPLLSSPPVEVWSACSKARCAPNCIAVMGAMELALTCADRNQVCVRE